MYVLELRTYMQGISIANGECWCRLQELSKMEDKDNVVPNELVSLSW